MSMERPSLADVFKTGGGVPDRSAGLGGLLPPAPSSPAPSTTAARKPAAKKPAVEHDASAPPVPMPTEAVDQIGNSEKAVRSWAKKTRATAPTDTVAGNVGVYIEPDVLDAIRKAKREVPAGVPEPTYDELLVEALGKVTVEALTAYFTPDPVPSESLIPARRRRPRGSAGIQIQVRLDLGQMAAIDNLARETAAPSRSAFVAAAYRLSLLGS